MPARAVRAELEQLRYRPQLRESQTRSPRARGRVREGRRANPLVTTAIDTRVARKYAMSGAGRARVTPGPPTPHDFGFHAEAVPRCALIGVGARQCRRSARSRASPARDDSSSRSPPSSACVHVARSHAPSSGRARVPDAGDELGRRHIAVLRTFRRPSRYPVAIVPLIVASACWNQVWRIPSGSRKRVRSEVRDRVVGGSLDRRGRGHEVAIAVTEACSRLAYGHGDRLESLIGRPAVLGSCGAVSCQAAGVAEEHSQRDPVGVREVRKPRRDRHVEVERLFLGKVEARAWR